LPAPYPILIGAADTGQQMIRLADMGRSDGVRLEGTSTEGSVLFSTRQDDTFTAARISLALSYSAAVGRDGGELSIYLNNEFLGSSAIGKNTGVKSHAEFSFNPAFLTTNNRLTIKFAVKGQGANACRVARDKTFWVKIDPASFVYMSSFRGPSSIQRINSLSDCPLCCRPVLNQGWCRLQVWSRDILVCSPSTREQRFRWYSMACLPATLLSWCKAIAIRPGLLRFPVKGHAWR
jgi:hypothetical protein